MLKYEEYQGQPQLYGAKLQEFIGLLLAELDKRLVKTCLKTLEAIITFRHSVYGLASVSLARAA